MKKEKRRIGEAFLEVLLEIGLSLVCFAIGAAILCLCGIKLDLPSIDSELIILIGVIALLLILMLVCASVQWVKKIKNKDK
jgi:hypothetical protein